MLILMSTDIMVNRKGAQRPHFHGSSLSRNQAVTHNLKERVQTSSAPASSFWLLTLFISTETLQCQDYSLLCSLHQPRPTLRTDTSLPQTWMFSDLMMRVENFESFSLPCTWGWSTHLLSLGPHQPAAGRKEREKKTEIL